MWSPGSASLGLLALLGAFAIASPSFSEEKCNLRSGFFFENRDGRQFVGLFRIALDPPDLRNPAAIKRHVVFAETWAHTITEEIFTKTGGVCDAIIVSEGFPDLRAFLTVRRTAGQIDRERVVCAHVLQDLLNHFEPDEGQIKRAVDRETSLTRPIQPSTGTNAVEPSGDVWNISQAALRVIYKNDSVLHALVSISAGPPASVDAADLRAWLGSQQSRSQLLLEQIPYCLPPHADLASSSDIPQERRDSDILPAGEINLSRTESGPIPPGLLGHMVMVGDPGEPPTVRTRSEVETKYCWQEHTFSIEEKSSPRTSITLTLRCWTISIYDLDSWNLIYCDPKNCTSERIEKAVMAAIASDPRIIEFARRSSNTAVPRGPYLISVK